METCPIIALREREGLTRREFALQRRISYHALSVAELGYPCRLPPTIHGALAAAGYDANALAAEYAAWRDRQGEGRGART